MSSTILQRCQRHNTTSKVTLIPPLTSTSEGHNGNSTKKGLTVKPKLVKKSMSSSTTNSGDEKIGEIDAPVQEKYRILQRLGKGAYGIVWEALELKPNGKKVALKKIFDAFRNNTDAQRTYREIFFLLQFGHHPNIISLTNGHQAQNDLDFYLCFPLMSTDLHKIVKSAPEKIGREVMCSILYQVSKAILYLHSADVIHRDLKPANILLDENMNAKLGDFGLARSVSAIDGAGDGHPEMTDYIATRWYRPPEILLNSKVYTRSVDIWALACILGEMVKKGAIFAASNTLEQIEMVLGTIEMASRNELEEITSESMRSVAQAAMKCRKPSIRDILVGQDPEAVDLIEKILVFSPRKRPTIEDVIAHPLFRWNRCVSEEIRFEGRVTPPINDNVCFPLSNYRSFLYEMLKNGELLGPKRTSSEFKQERIRQKRNKVSVLTVPSTEPGFADQGGGGDAWVSACRSVDHDIFHSFSNPAGIPWNQVEMDQGKTPEKSPEGYIYTTQPEAPSRNEVKLPKRKRKKRVSKEKSKVPITQVENMKANDDVGASFKTTDPIRKWTERLGTAPPYLQARRTEIPEHYPSSSQFNSQSRNGRDGDVRISIPTAADASAATSANKSKLPRPIQFKKSLLETVKQLGSVDLGSRGPHLDIEMGGGDAFVRRPSTTLPFSRTSGTTLFPKLTEEILPSRPSTRGHSKETLRQFPYYAEQPPQPDFLTSGLRGGRPQNSELFAQDAIYRSDNLFFTPGSEPQASLSFVDERPPSRSSVRKVELNRNGREKMTNTKGAPIKYQEEVQENWRDCRAPGAFPNPQRQSTLNAPTFQKSTNNGKKSPAEYREKLKHSSYFPGVELNNRRNTPSGGVDNRNGFNASSSTQFNKETQRSRIAATMNNLPKNSIGLTVPEPGPPTRKKPSSRPLPFSNRPPTHPVKQLLGRPTMVLTDSRVPPFENYTKVHATISSKDLDDLKATFSRVGRY